MTNCGSCGIELSETSRFCSSCGWAAGKNEFSTRTMAPAAPTPTPDPVDGSRFPPGIVLGGRYRIVSLLGRGGMGEVYRAEDLTLGQQVALKFLPERVARSASAIERFRGEVRTARKVSHPNVCRVYDLAEAEGRPFISMEYVDGENLDSLLKRIGRLPMDKALEISRRLCAGLAAAHEKGILHRDLKPANVMLDGRGEALLTDFGLAAAAGQVEGIEVRNGTPAYMAPEQLAGKEVSVRSDIYSLGLVLYEIFTGKRAFESPTLAGLLNQRRESRPRSPSTHVPDLDPAVERVILRCLEPEPSARPASALAVAAALPGGDPLAAALAAGETPSPQMVAAAGEGLGLAPRVAVPLLATVIAALATLCVMTWSSSALEGIHPEYPPEVLAQKAKDVAQRFGYPGAAADSAYGFSWLRSLLDYLDHSLHSPADWREALTRRPPLLQFWYRQSESPLVALGFHDDHLTPGLVDPDDPPATQAGMTGVELDSRGRLLYFESMPPQMMEAAGAPRDVDWIPLFGAAELNPALFQPAEPLWTFLAASDTRLAWTGTWPGTDQPLRIEAAAFRGKPVAFALLGPWVKPWRAAPEQPPVRDQLNSAALALLFLIPCIGGPLLARRNLAQGRGDRRGALRLGLFVVAIQMAMWLCRSHFTASFATFGMFILAVGTAIFYGLAGCVVYLAVEPFVRRHWPHTLISWTNVLAGRIADPIVGRDVLCGVGLGLCWWLISANNGLGQLVMMGHMTPALARPDLLLGVRSALGSWLLHIPGSIRDALVMVLLLLLLRAVLRNEWLAGGVYALFFGLINCFSDTHAMMNGSEAFLTNVIIAIVVVRLGLLALVVGMLVFGVARDIPVTTNTSAWYFGNSVFFVLSIFALAFWGFYHSIAAGRFWRKDLLG